MPQTRRSSRRSSILTASTNLSKLKEQKTIHEEKDVEIVEQTKNVHFSSPNNGQDEDQDEEGHQVIDDAKNKANSATKEGENEKRKKKKKRTISERSPALNKSRKKSTTFSVKKASNDCDDSNNTNNHPSTPTKENVVDDCGNDKENQPLTPSVTPYWKVAEERGTFSPRQTRSAKKSNRPSNIPRYSDASPTQSTKKEGRSTSKKGKSDKLAGPEGNNNHNHHSTTLQEEQRKLFQDDRSKSSNNDNDNDKQKATNSYKSTFCLDFSPQANVNISQSKNSTKQLKEEIINLNKQIKSLQFNLDSSQKKNVDLEKEITNLQARFEYQRDVKNLDMRLTKLSNDLNNQSAQQELVEIISGLREEKKNLQLKLDEADRSNKKILENYERHQNENDNHCILVEQEVMDSIRERLDEEKQQRVIAESNYQKIMNDLESFHKETGDLQGLVNSLKEDNEHLKDTLEQEIKRGEKRKSEYEETIEALKETLNESQSIDTNALATALEEKMKVISQLEKIESELEMKNSTIFNMSDKEAELAKMNEDLLQRCEESEKEVIEIRSESKNLRESLTLKSSMVEELQQKLEESEVVYDVAEKLRKDLKELQTAIEEEAKTNDKLREQSILLQQTLNETSQEAEQTKEHLSNQIEMREELEVKLKSARSDIEKKQESLDAKDKQQMELSKTNKDLATNVNELNEKLNDTTERHSNEKKDFLEKIAVLEQKIVEAEAKQKEEEKKHRAELESVNVELKKEKRMNEQLNEQLFQTMEQHDTDKKQYRRQLAEKNAAIEDLQKRCKKITKQMSTFNARESSLCEKILMQEEVRRSLHNRVMQLSGNIRVFVRVRPTISGEVSNSASPYTYPTIYDRSKPFSDTSVSVEEDDLTKRFIVATEPEKDRGGLSQRRKKLKFGFDNVFGPTHGQDGVWQATEPLVQSAIDGYNVCVFAYGQTGSGKTYTMLGTEANPGLITNAMQKLFNSKRTIEATSKGKTTIKISVELLEIYNEQVRDLLNEKKGMAGYEDINLTLNSSEAVGNIVYEAIDEEQVMTVLKKAQTRRCVKATKSNAESSRSHLIFTLNFNLLNASGVERKSRLSICDLAGSERLSKSESQGSARKEAQHINKSLSSLSNVIEKLQQKSSHIPYRESKLTYLLQNSLGGDSKTLAIVCCNPMVDHFQETTCSLRFAQKLNKVELKALANISC